MLITTSIYEVRYHDILQRFYVVGPGIREDNKPLFLKATAAKEAADLFSLVYAQGLEDGHARFKKQFAALFDDPNAWRRGA